MRTAHSHFLTALAATRMELASRLDRVTSDRAFTQSLGWGLENSAGGAMGIALVPGELDRLQLVNSACAVVARAGAAPAIKTPCPTGRNGDERTGDSGAPDGVAAFRWFEAEGRPVLALTVPVVPPGRPQAPPLWLSGAVVLGPDWLALNPDLAGSMRALALELTTGGPSAVGRLVMDGPPAQAGTQPPQLIMNSFIDRRLGFTGLGPPPLSDAQQAVELAGLLLLVLTLLRTYAGESLRRREARLERLRLISWCRSTLDTCLEGQGVQTPDPSGGHDLEPRLETARELMTRALEAMESKRRHAVIRCRELEARHQDREAMLARQRQRLTEFAELDSLAEQLARTTSAFLNRMRDLRARADQLTAHADGELSSRLAGISARLKDWQDGVKRRGARRFFRSLSEAPGRTPEVSRLDEELTAAADAAEAALAASALTRGEVAEIAATADFAVRIAGLWHSIVLPSDRLASPASVTDPVQHAQELVRLEPQLAATVFQNHLESAGIRPPAASRSVWVTALYHVYVAQAEVTLGTPAVISTRVRLDPQRQMLVIQIHPQGPHSVPRRSDREAYHLEIARHLLAPFEIEITSLPTAHGPRPVVLSWRAGAETSPPKAKTAAPDLTRDPAAFAVTGPG